MIFISSSECKSDCKETRLDLYQLNAEIFI